jgi:hypothetical protein
MQAIVIVLGVLVSVIAHQLSPVLLMEVKLPLGTGLGLVVMSLSYPVLV